MPQRQEIQRTLHGDVIAPSPVIGDRAVAPSVEPGVYPLPTLPRNPAILDPLQGLIPQDFQDFVQGSCLSIHFS